MTVLDDVQHDALAAKVESFLENELKIRTDREIPVGGSCEPDRWWRVVLADGSLWCETSDEREARTSMTGRKAKGSTLEKHMILTAQWWEKVEK